MTACGRISQLEVCQLLTSGLQVAYPVEFNGHEDPIIASLPESLANGTSLTGRQIHLPRGQHPATHGGRARPEGIAPWQMLFYPNSQPPQDHSPKTGREVSMTMEVRSLLSQVMVDMSGHGSGNFTPKRPNPVVILTPPTHKLRDLSRLVDASSQVSTLNDIKKAEASLEEVSTTISPIAVTQGSRSITPPADMGQLLEKANKALEELLATKSSMDACRWKVVWELGMELHQNYSKTVESIKEARAICIHATLDAEAHCSTTVKEAKAT